MSKYQRRVGLLIAAVALVGALAPAAPEPPANSAPEPLAVNKPLAAEQLKLIGLIVADMDRLVKGGQMTLGDPAINLWARRRVDALRATGASKAEMVAASEKYLDRMKIYENSRKGQYERDLATRADLLAAQYERLEAEMWLNQEKAK